MVTKERYFNQSEDVEALSFDWGTIAITVSPEASGAERFSAGIVVMQPGGGHGRHNHSGAEEIIHVISGTGEQMVEDEVGHPVIQKVGPGTSIYVPASRYHSTRNTGHDPMTVFVVYAPAGPEEILRTLPGCKISSPRRERN